MMHTPTLLIRILGISAVGCWLLASAAFADTFTEGIDYVLVSPPVKEDAGEDKVTVREFFWYGCPHCYTLEPHIENWDKPEHIEFVTMPAMLGKQWLSHGYAYYALEALGRLEELHPVLFDALHTKRQNLFTPEQLAKFFSGHGIPEETFLNALNSFTVDTKVKAAQNLGKKYNLRSVPTVVINGKYMTSPSMVGYKRLFEVVEHLAELERPAKTVN